MCITVESWEGWMKRNAVSKPCFNLFLLWCFLIFTYLWYLPLFAHIRHLCTGSILVIHIINLEHYSTFLSFRRHFELLYTYSFESLMVQWKMSVRSVRVRFARSQLPWCFNLRSSLQDMIQSDTKEVRKPNLRRVFVSSDLWYFRVKAAPI